MRNFLQFLLVAICLYVGYEYLRMSPLWSASDRLQKQTVAYESTTGFMSVLVLGDDFAMGVGAVRPEDSIPAIIADHLGASVDNHARPGATADDLPDELAQVQGSGYDLAIVQVGANDILSFHNLDASDRVLGEALTELQSKAKRIVVFTGDKLGDAPIFPSAASVFIKGRAAALRNLFVATSEDNGALYVDLYNLSDDTFAMNPRRYYASDMLHPSSEGYALWAGIVGAAIDTRWPDLRYGSQ